MNYFLTLSFLLLIFFSGCGSTPQPLPIKCEDKAWMLNPNSNGKLGAVGSAMRTYDQKTSSQRKLAITRALDELSLQKGVKVSLNINKQDIVKNDKSTTTLESKSTYTTNNKITAHIEDACKDKFSGEFFIWMLLD